MAIFFTDYGQCWSNYIEYSRLKSGLLPRAARASIIVVASKTGVLAIFPALGVSMTKRARHLANRWTSSIFIGTCGFVADALIHESHYPGAYTEAGLTAIGTFALSIAVSYTRIGKYVDRLAEAFLDSPQHEPLSALRVMKS
jgi:hypothetical protein